MLARKHDELGREAGKEQPIIPDMDSAVDDVIGDDLLRLMFTGCHPLLASRRGPRFPCG